MTRGRASAVPTSHLFYDQCPLAIVRPTTRGTFSFTRAGDDSRGATADRTFSITINQMVAAARGVRYFTTSRPCIPLA